MQVKFNGKYQTSLSNIAKLYAGIGYSVIPIYGDTQPQQAKVAAVNWKAYQSRRASDTQITHWFEQEHYGGVAIVTGRISNLVVLDFDDPQLQLQFESQFSDLLKTRIVTSASRGLSHYYYSLPTYINLPTRHINGADLLSNGCYVVAPPTMIDGNEYTIQRGGMPYQLNEYQVRRLQKFFNVESNASYQQQSAITINPQPQSLTDKPPAPKSISSQSLIHLYQHYAPKIGRNNALFKIACHARDYQMSVTEVKEILQHIHAQQSTVQLHISESESQRLKEAQQTIKSAFRLPPRPLRESNTIQLTNSIREALLKRQLTCVARVLDGLFLKGFKTGDVITKKVVFDVLSDVVGKHSIRAAFDAHIDDTPLWIPISVPPQPPSNTNVADGKARTTPTKCYLFTPPKPDKTIGGRIPAQFSIPDINALCHQLGVPFTRSDPLTLDDLQQAKTYRQAVHRELLKRRPGMYHRYWLAKRIGVSKRTSQRYDNETDVQRKPMYIYEHITWDDLGKIPTEDPIEGMFLEDADGKRYPGLRQIAARLLARKKSIRYAYQDMNYYWYGDRPPMPKVLWGINPRQPEVDAGREKTRQYIQQYWRDFHAKKHVKPISNHHTPNPQPSKAKSIAGEVYIPDAAIAYKPTLSEGRIDYLAQCLYQAVWDRAITEKSRLSKINARQLVEKYGEALIKRALGVLKYRKNISNPAGFIIVWLRSTATSIGA